MNPSIHQPTKHLSEHTKRQACEHAGRQARRQTGEQAGRYAATESGGPGAHKCAAAIAAAIATARVCAAALSLQPSDEFVVKRDDVNALVDDRAVPYTHGSATKREALAVEHA
eukprot:354376-Chlamydomonas_euryale.AAC.2